MPGREARNCNAGFANELPCKDSPFAAGAALDAFKMSVDTSESHWRGGFDYSYWGPQLYLIARF